WLTAVRNATDLELTVLDDKRTKKQLQIAWQTCPRDWITLNSDGSVLGAIGRTTIEGLLWDKDMGDAYRPMPLIWEFAKSRELKFVELLRELEEHGWRDNKEWRSKWIWSCGHSLPRGNHYLIL
ncbi:hypothetical protein LINPERPRIM_LOCUS12504, partial [Linum perenne]